MTNRDGHSSSEFQRELCGAIAYVMAESAADPLVPTKHRASLGRDRGRRVSEETRRLFHEAQYQWGCFGNINNDADPWFENIQKEIEEMDE